MSKIVQHSRASWSYLIHRLDRAAKWRELPVNPQADDLYLAEFPKSGVTWLSFLIGNANLLLAGEHDRAVTFYNLNDFVADIEVNRHLNPVPPPPLGFRVIKSHAAFNRFYTKVIYLVRDPRDVMASYWHFLTQLDYYQGSLATMLDDPRFGISSWCRHVTSWLEQAEPSQSVMVLKYEDLLRDTAGELQRIYRMLGRELSNEIVQLAVERSSIERMRESETLFNASHPALDGFDFVRKDAAGGPRQPLSPSEREQIARAAQPLMARLGYE
jgi:sulfotransferase family protein